MNERTGRLRRADRLLDSRDFRRVGRVGRRVASRYFVVLLAAAREPDGDGNQRLGVTVSRRVGNAVVRNRVKRAVREWFRSNRPGFESAADVVVIARREAADLSAAEIARVLNQQVFSKRQAAGT